MNIIRAYAKTEFQKYSSRDTVPFIGGGAGVLLPAGRLRLAAGLLLGVGHPCGQSQADQGKGLLKLRHQLTK